MLTGTFGIYDGYIAEQLGERIWPPEALSGRWDVNEIVKAEEILGLMELPHVPQNRMLVKGVLESPGKMIPLMDLRVRLTAAGTRDDDRAAALVVNVGGSEIGLILDGSSTA